MPQLKQTTNYWELRVGTLAWAKARRAAFLAVRAWPRRRAIREYGRLPDEILRIILSIAPVYGERRRALLTRRMYRSVLRKRSQANPRTEFDVAEVVFLLASRRRARGAHARRAAPRVRSSPLALRRRKRGLRQDAIYDREASRRLRREAAESRSPRKRASRRSGRRATKKRAAESIFKDQVA